MSREYFNGMAGKWDEQVAEKDRARLESLAESLDIRAGAQVLDVGSGTGIFVPFLLKKVGGGGRVVCLDYAAEMLDKAKEKQFAGNISYVCADIQESGLAGESFDAVVCYASFPHFRDKGLALREIQRVLKRGGTLYLAHTASRESINRVHKNIGVLAGDLIPEAGALHKMLSEAGFQGVEISEGPESYRVTAVKGGRPGQAPGAQL